MNSLESFEFNEELIGFVGKVRVAAVECADVIADCKKLVHHVYTDVFDVKIYELDNGYHVIVDTVIGNQIAGEDDYVRCYVVDKDGFIEYYGYDESINIFMNMFE